MYRKSITCQVSAVCTSIKGPGGGGGALKYLGWYIRSLSKFKNTSKALISGPKSALILKKRCPFPVKNTTSFIKTLTLDEQHQMHKSGSILLNYRLGSPVPSRVTRRQSRKYFVRGLSPPILRTWVQKCALILQIADMQRY